VSDHPVLVQHRGGHTAFVNSMAFQLAKITDQTPDPAGGRLEHDSAGQLTGFVGDAAAQIFLQLIPQKNTRQDYRQGAALISKMFTRNGVTSACDADASPHDVEGYQDARDAVCTATFPPLLSIISWLPEFIPVSVTNGCASEG